MPLADQARPVDGTCDPARPATRGTRSPAAAWLGPVAGLVSLVVFVIGSWVPAYWLDEATTLFAVRRSWGQLILLFRGDPSLVPYYLLMKPFAMVSESEAWLRLPGEVAAAAAVALLVVGVRRVAGTWPAALAGACTVAAPTTSLYAQMVRPYPFLLLLVVAAAVTWWQSVETGRRRWLIAYGALYFGIGLANMYGLIVIIPLVLAAWFAPPGSRASALRRTLVPMLVAVACLLPYLIVTALQAPGPGRIQALTPEGVVDTLARAIGSPAPAIIMAALALLGLVATPEAANAGIRRLRWLAGTWGFGLPLVLVAAQAVGLRTLAPRYFLFVLPAVAVLAGLGAWRLARWWRPLGIAAVAVLVAAGIPDQIEVRSPPGHRAGPAREVAAAVQVPALASLPVVANPTLMTLSRLAAYAPGVLDYRMPLLLDPAPSGALFLFRLPDPQQIQANLAPFPAVVVIGEPAPDDGPLFRDTEGALRQNGFTGTWTTCSIGGTIVTIWARPDRGGELPSPEVIDGQIRQVAPRARCTVG